MPVYNRAVYLAEAVNSILNQTYPFFELIVVDDGSTDNSLDIIKNFKDKRIKVLSLPHNKGIPFARNAGLATITGDFYAVQDSDDISMPNRFEQQIRLFNENPQIAACGSQAIFLIRMA
ncbi:MAG: glycosyltransferase family 2 protein [Microscillaceae bacterium]|nr:glycosyltransferase family 2 protein [Microscillaceae bacterium]